MTVSKAAKPATSEARRSSILDAATPVFVRFGFKKASMDEAARAAGISRQALYSHFVSKEALFKEVVLRILAAQSTAANAALHRAHAPIEERLLDTFEAMHAHTIGQIGAEQMSELRDTAASLVGPVFQQLEERLVRDVAAALATSGAAAAWDRARVSAVELADNLYSTSSGLKHRASTLADYRSAMRIAIRIMCSGGARPSQEKRR